MNSIGQLAHELDKPALYLAAEGTDDSHFGLRQARTSALKAS
jgi:hypothetical protein